MLMDDETIKEDVVVSDKGPGMSIRALDLTRDHLIRGSFPHWLAVCEGER